MSEEDTTQDTEAVEAEEQEPNETETDAPEAEGITEAGEIVGWSGTASGENQAVRWVDGRISAL